MDLDNRILEELADFATDLADESAYLQDKGRSNLDHIKLVKADLDRVWNDLLESAR